MRLNDISIEHNTNNDDIIIECIVMVYVFFSFSMKEIFCCYSGSEKPIFPIK